MTERIALPSPRRRAVAWLAVVALLGNFLLPTMLSIGTGPLGTVICSTTAGDLPHKAKPGLVVHHCALCTKPAALTSGAELGACFAAAFAEKAHLSLHAAPLAASYWHGGVQARAPPVLA